MTVKQLRKWLKHFPPEDFVSVGDNQHLIILDSKWWKKSKSTDGKPTYIHIERKP